MCSFALYLRCICSGNLKVYVIKVSPIHGHRWKRRRKWRIINQTAVKFELDRNGCCGRVANKPRTILLQDQPWILRPIGSLTNVACVTSVPSFLRHGHSVTLFRRKKMDWSNIEPLNCTSAFTVNECAGSGGRCSRWFLEICICSSVIVFVMVLSIILFSRTTVLISVVIIDRLQRESQYHYRQ